MKILASETHRHSDKIAHELEDESSHCNHDCRPPAGQLARLGMNLALLLL